MKTSEDGTQNTQPVGKVFHFYVFKFFCLIFFAALHSAPANGADWTNQLGGTWRLELDREDVGIKERWFSRTLPEKIRLPGSLPEQGFGDDIAVSTKWTGEIVDRSWFTDPEYAPYRQPGNIKVPFWLQPDKYYAGVAWYQRRFAIPAKWSGKRLSLTLERPHWATTVWVDDREVGSNDSLSTPHRYDMGIVGALARGEHKLTIRVDNRLVMDIGVNSHSISEHTQGNWNGIVGGIELAATAPVWIDELQAYPNFRTKSVRVKGTLGNSAHENGSDSLDVTVIETTESARQKSSAAKRTVLVNWSDSGGSFDFEMPVEKAKPWSEFSPSLFELRAVLKKSKESKRVRFGFRELTTEGTQFALNGSKIFIRGTLECCIFPKTGHPPTDVDSWKRIVRIAKAYGLNLIRFHSWCPPEAAFAAADELGFYYQVEIASWANQSTTLGDGKPVDEWLYCEAGRILKAYGNHPSFLLMPYGNEPGGTNANEYLAKWVTHWKETDPRRFYTSGSGWPQLPENQFHVTPEPRIQAWGQGLNSRINASPPETCTDYRAYIRAHRVPVISHEIGEWCVYPNFDEIPKYTGYLKPKNFEIFRDSLRAHHMGDLAHRFLIASGKLQTLCYKEEIESALRTPGMAGFELLDLHDFPGQGTALVGVLDPFWDSKGYVSAAQYSRFCNSTVPLARLSKRVFNPTERLTAEIEVAHFGPEPLEQAVAVWELVGTHRKVVLSGSLPARDVPLGNGLALGRIEADLRSLPAPAQYTLLVRLTSKSVLPPSERLSYENDWDIWVYPAGMAPEPAGDVTFAQELDEAVLGKLAAGGKVLLDVPIDCVKGDRYGKVGLGFSSIFWNTAWTGRQPPHTLGILCDPNNPAFKEFPTEDHSNWQWWYLVSRAGAMILDNLPSELAPTVQVIDDWATNRKLALLFEANVGAGKLMVCSIDLKNHLEQNLVARQLLHSLLDYMKSAKFKPAVQLTPDQVRSVMSGS